MTHKEIEHKRQKLIEILKMKPVGEQNQPLRNLAVEVGAQQPNASGVEFRNMIVNDINNALQTASMIETCRIATENYEIAVTATKAAVKNYWIAAAIAILAMLAAWAAVVAIVIIAVLTG